jgi:hypothetical protein
MTSISNHGYEPDVSKSVFPPNPDNGAPKEVILKDITVSSVVVIITSDNPPKVPKSAVALGL